jgi:hemerythrin-like domain-containing protein
MPSDPFEMAMVHRAFRSELHNATGLVRGVTAGDTRRSAAVGAHIDFVMTALHHHHLAEDAVVWPTLSARAPSRAAEVNRMEDAHRGIADTSERVRATAARWAESGDPGLAGQLVPLVEEFAGRVDAHLDDEERNVVPLIAEYLSPKEWRKFLAHRSAFVRTHPKRGIGMGVHTDTGSAAGGSASEITATLSPAAW